MTEHLYALIVATILHGDSAERLHLRENMTAAQCRSAMVQSIQAHGGARVYAACVPMPPAPAAAPQPAETPRPPAPAPVAAMGVRG